VRERGDSSEIDLFKDKEITNNYMLNLADICPVGAITSKDFRFKKRVWYLESTPGICLGCATGCNIKIQHHENRIYRLLPEENPSVNGRWMCDTGRMSYKITQDDQRCRDAGSYRNGQYIVMEYKQVVEEIKNEIGTIIRDGRRDDIGVLGSASLSLEDNLVLAEFAKNVIKTRIFCMEFPFEQGISDGMLFNKDPQPNTRGAKMIHSAYGGIPLDEFIKEINAGRIKVLFIAGNDLALLQKKITKNNLKIIGFYNTLKNAFTDIDYLLPIPTYFSWDGHFVNYKGIVQKTCAAISIDNGVKPIIDHINEISLKSGLSIEVKDVPAIYKKLKEKVSDLKDFDFKREENNK